MVEEVHPVTGRIKKLAMFLIFIMIWGSCLAYERSYVVTFELYQVNYTLSVRTHLRNMANTITFQIPVSETYYHQVYIGQEIVDEMRVGSAILRGSFGKWKIKVKNKQSY